MTAIAAPSTDIEDATFAQWHDAILNPPPMSSEDRQAEAAANWILSVYLYQSPRPGRRDYYDQVAAWAQGQLSVFGRIGTAVGTHASDQTSIACVGFWDGHNGSTVAWQMTTLTGSRRYLIAGARDHANVLIDLVIFDITGVTLSPDPKDAELYYNGKFKSLSATPSYQTLDALLNGIKRSPDNWP
jgi:hypothetical protein